MTCLRMCGLMVQCTLGEVKLAPLLEEEGRTAFLEVKNALELTFGEITDECLKELVERSLCYAAEFGADNGDDGPQTFNALLSCFSSKGGKAVHEKQGHLRTPEFTGFNACAELASKDWSSEQIRNRFNEQKGHGKRFALFKAYERTPPPSLWQKFTDTPYHKTFAWMCGTERSQLNDESAPKDGVILAPVETLAAIKKLKELAEEGKPPPVSRYAFVAAENSTNEEELVRLKRAIGMDDPSIDKNDWNPTAVGYLACKELLKRGFNADSITSKLGYTRAEAIFNSFVKYRGILMDEKCASSHPFYRYIIGAARPEATKGIIDGNVKEISNFTTLQAIYMLQALAADETRKERIAR